MDNIICVVSSGRFDKNKILLVGISSALSPFVSCDGGGGADVWPLVSRKRGIVKQISNISIQNM